MVTGASAGIGLATAKLFGKQDAKVALAARFRKKRSPIVMTTCGLTFGASCCFLDEIWTRVRRTTSCYRREQCSSGASELIRPAGNARRTGKSKADA